MTTTTHAATDIGATPDTGETDYEICTLDIGGMTCASCVGRIEKSLLKLDGVTDARVNLATEVASVTYAPEALNARGPRPRAVTKAGYTATPRRTSRPRHRGRRDRRRRQTATDDEQRPRPRADEAQVAGRAGHRPRADGADVRPALHRHHGLADAGDLRASPPSSSAGPARTSTPPPGRPPSTAAPT